MVNLILFGPPGSGKGTQAKKIAAKYNFLHISTGDLFRHEIGNETLLGKEAKSYIDRGALVPDSVTIDMLRNEVERHPGVGGIIFDGFPRNILQAESLDELLAERDQMVTALVALEVDEEEIVQRILERGKTSGRPDDTDESVIRHRFQVYNEETTPLFEYYQEKGKAHTIVGLGEIDEIFDRLCTLLDTLASA